MLQRKENSFSLQGSLIVSWFLHFCFADFSDVSPLARRMTLVPTVCVAPRIGPLSEDTDRDLSGLCRLVGSLHSLRVRSRAVRAWHARARPRCRCLDMARELGLSTNATSPPNHLFGNEESFGPIVGFMYWQGANA